MSGAVARAIAADEAARAAAAAPPREPNPATENEAGRGTRPADRHHVSIDPMPGGGR